MERGFVLPSGQLGWSTDGGRKVFAGLLEPLIPPGKWRHPVRPALRCTACGIALVHYAAADPA